MTISKRIYHFDLPHMISGVQDTFGVNELQSDGMWPKIPADVQRKMLAGESWFGPGVSVTQADLDELPDDVLAYVANKLDLKWSKATS
jgi:hypothetical protein